MKTFSRIFAAAIAVAMAALPVAEASAQGYHQPPHREAPRKPAPHVPARPQPHKPAPAPHAKPLPPKPQAHKPKPQAHKPMPQKRKWARGQRFNDWKRYSEVRDYRRHGLKRPAPGHRWVRVDNDYLLVTIASGIIAGIIAGR